MPSFKLNTAVLLGALFGVSNAINVEHWTTITVSGDVCGTSTEVNYSVAGNAASGAAAAAGNAAVTTSTGAAAAAGVAASVTTIATCSSDICVTATVTADPTALAAAAASAASKALGLAAQRSSSSTKAGLTFSGASASASGASASNAGLPASRASSSSSSGAAAASSSSSSSGASSDAGLPASRTSSTSSGASSTDASSSSSSDATSATSSDSAAVTSSSATTTDATTSSDTTTATTSSSTTGFSPTETGLAADSDFAQEVLAYHNYVRDIHGSVALTWDQTLANYAQSYADYLASDSTCPFAHSGGSYGENLAIGYDTLLASMKAWYDENQYYDYTTGDYVQAASHFTQMIWNDSTTIGCGYAQCSPTGGSVYATGYYLVCEYNPRGNYLGEFTTNVLTPSATTTAYGGPTGAAW